VAPAPNDPAHRPVEDNNTVYESVHQDAISLKAAGNRMQ
jgi:hypothetical protein